MSPARAKVLVLGGYGAFGAKVAERLSRDGSLALVVAGRSATKARTAAESLTMLARREVAHAVIDAVRPDLDALRKLAPDILINASGPYQAQDYTLARAAIGVGAHYIDLADAHAFVTGIAPLDGAARAANVLVTSGASSVPALAAAIVDSHLPDFATLLSLHHGITPGNAYDPGEATTASILSGVGRPIQMMIDGRWQVVHGWHGLFRYDFPGLGRRWMAHCDVPDVELFPQRYPHLRTARFSAGLEVTMLQAGLWSLAALVRIGLLRRPERLAPALLALKRRLSGLGSDAGGMFVRMAGVGRDGRPLERAVHLLARRNHGPYVPAIASVLIARKLSRGEIDVRGAMPCLGNFTLDEFMAEVADLDIAIETTPRG